MKWYLVVVLLLFVLIAFAVGARLQYCRRHVCWAQPDPPCLEGHIELRYDQLLCINGGSCQIVSRPEYVCDVYGPTPPKQRSPL